MGGASMAIVINFWDSPVLITGCARSGTSMTAGIVNLCGAWKGETGGPNKNNRKGMFENGGIRENIIKPTLRKMGYDPMGQSPLPDIDYIAKVAQGDTPEVLKAQMFDIIKSQGYTGNGPWMYKGAKMCLLWPIFHKMFPNAKWIVTSREAKEIVQSCLRTRFMRAYQDEAGWKGWVHEHLKRFNEMGDAGLDMRFVNTNSLACGNLSGIRNAVADCRLTWMEDLVKQFVDPSLWNGGVK